jgi:hypothetical protein
LRVRIWYWYALPLFQLTKTVQMCTGPLKSSSMYCPSELSLAPQRPPLFVRTCSIWSPLEDAERTARLECMMSEEEGVHRPDATGTDGADTGGGGDEVGGDAAVEQELSNVSRFCPPIAPWYAQWRESCSHSALPDI